MLLSAVNTTLQSCHSAHASSLKRFSGDAPLKGVRILYVEDSVNEARLRQNVLERAGAMVTYCSSVEEARQKVTQRPGFNLLLTDGSLNPGSWQDVVALFPTIPGVLYTADPKPHSLPTHMVYQSKAQHSIRDVLPELVKLHQANTSRT